MKKKKILIATGIFQPEIGGPASFAKALGQKLAETAEVSVFTYSSVRKFSEDGKLNFKVIRIWKKLPWFIRHIIYFFKIFWSARTSDTLFSLSTLNGSIPCLVGAKFFKKKFLVRIVGDYAWQAAAEKYKTNLLIDDFQKLKKSGWVGFLFWLQSWICRKADTIVMPSEYLAGLVEGWGVKKEKIRVIYNGSDFKPLELDKEEARKKIGVAGNILISYGRLVPWKGFRMLIKIMPQLLKINQFFRLVVVGDGSEKRALELMVRNLGLEKKVYLVGRKNQEELALYLAASDIFILNTSYEGFSHQILEVMAAKVPVITTSAGGNREIIHQGENGFMVKYNDEFNIIEAIKTVWQIPELRQRFIEEGLKTTEYFNVEKMISKVTKLLI